jgi:hypothetical protein
MIWRNDFDGMILTDLKYDGRYIWRISTLFAGIDGTIFFFNFGQKIKIKLVLDSHWLGEKEYVY